MPIIIAPHPGDPANPPVLIIAPGANLKSTTDLAAKTIAWFGQNPSNPEQNGLWVGGGLWIGGSSTANAPIFADASGNLTIRNGTLFGVGSGAIFSGDAGGSVRINNFGAPGGPVPLDVEGKIRSSSGYRVGSANGATGYVEFTGNLNGTAGIIRLNYSGGIITGGQIVG